MVQFRHAQREIQFKVVYYGPALGGKTTNLEALHEITDPEGKTQLVSLKTAEDRTLFFDFLPFDLGEIQGYHIRFQVYTVPGQVHYNTTRKVVLAGTDAIIFVADSQADRAMENFISWENMKANLLANKMDIHQTPIIIQCNKRDLPGVLSKEQILSAMKAEEAPATLSSAISGEGVVETFMLCVQQTLALFSDKYKLEQKGATSEKIAEGVTAIFQPFIERRRAAQSPGEEVGEPLSAKLPLHGLSEEEQLVAALQSSTQLAEEYQEAQLLSRMYQARLKEMTALHEIGKSLQQSEDLEPALNHVARHLAEARPYWTVSVFKKGPDGPEPLACLGCDEDPLWQTDAPGAGNLALGLLQSGERMHLDNLQERLQQLKVPPPQNVGEALSIPLGGQGRPLGFLIVYAPPDQPITREEDRFLSLLEQVVSPRLQTVALLKELAAANEYLELKVTERTADLQVAMEQLKELDQLKRAFLNNVSHEMKTPLTNIRSYADLLKRYPQQREKNAEEYLQIVHDESVHLEGLINDLLSYTKVKEPPRGDSCDLVAVLDEVMQLLDGQAEQRGLKIQVQKEKDTLPFGMNREDATILFRQILDNAIKFSPDGVKVKVYLLHDPRKVVFAVRDYGPGFPKDQRERLLEPFEADKPAVPSYKTPGLGMGLFLVREVLSKYGGGIAIENMEPGSNVLVELPKHPK
jgi:signal transduction histidine kinase/signal recognition particle receptor subunit beta